MLWYLREKGKNLPISPEGIPYLFLFFLLLLLFRSSLIPYILFLFTAFFFRNPKRTPPKGENLIVSPADGKVIAIEEREGDITISIFMSLFDVHVNRAPLDGVVERMEYKKGKFYPAFRKDLTKDNERNIIFIRSGNFNYSIKQVAGIIARRIVCYVRRGSRLKKGEVIGIICFGSLVEVSLPKDHVDIVVTKGKKVKAGETVIGVVK